MRCLELGYLKFLRFVGSYGALIILGKFIIFPAEAMDHKSEGASGVALQKCWVFTACLLYIWDITVVQKEPPEIRIPIC